MEIWILLGFVVLILILIISFKRNGNATVNRKKSIFISGCDSGIGYKLATHLDSLGCTVYAGCLVPDGEGAILLRQETSDRLKVISLDVTKQESINDAVKSVKDDLNGKDLWALVNNAGVCVCGEFDWLTTNQCRYQLNVNLYGTIAVTKTFLPLIRQSKGRIVNITSVSGHCTYPGVSVYCATKFGLEGFSDCLRLELAKFGVEVIVIQPADLSRLTRIMANHEVHVKEMWNNMSVENKHFYGEYFQKYHDKVLQNYEAPSNENLESTTLLKDVEDDLWCLVNNAGVCIYGEFDWLTHKQCRQQLDVNLYGTISMTKAFLPLIRQSKGRIVNITSVNGQCAYPGLSVYSATKFALEGFSDVLRLELAKFGIRVIIIQPGDFARLTCIMNNHQHHMKEMWDNMSEQDKIVYDDYFQKYHSLVLKNAGLTCPPTFASTSLLTDVQEALFSSTPSPRYVVTSLPFKIFFFLVRVLPTRWTDSLILYVVKKIFDGEVEKRDV